MRALKTLTLIVVMALAACGGGAETTDTTIADDGTTSTIADATTVTSAADDAGTVEDIDDMPAECVDLMVSFFQAIEPALEDFDFATMTMEDMETLGTELESVTSGFEDDIENLSCPDFETTDEEAFAAMIDIAEREAPGVVGYLEWIRDFASTADTIGSDTSGDCETDIAAMEAIIAENATMVDLTMEQRVEVLDLVSSISAGCSIDRQQEFFSQEDVSAFMGG